MHIKYNAVKCRELGYPGYDWSVSIRQQQQQQHNYTHATLYTYIQVEYDIIIYTECPHTNTHYGFVNLHIATATNNQLHC